MYAVGEVISLIFFFFAIIKSNILFISYTVEIFPVLQQQLGFKKVPEAQIIQVT